MLYQAKGIVWGNAWGGGKLGYQARQLESESLKDLRKEITKALGDGSLDSGMGFESLVGAVMEICETETIRKDGKDFEHTDYWTEVFGDLDDETSDYLTGELISTSF